MKLRSSVPRSCEEIRQELATWNCGIHKRGEKCGFGKGRTASSQCYSASYFRYRDLVVAHMIVCQDQDCDLKFQIPGIDSTTYGALQSAEVQFEYNGKSWPN